MKTKKTPKIQYGIEITKPHSKEMYDHNDKVAVEMKRNVLSAIHIAYSQAEGTIAADGGMTKGEETLRELVHAFTGYSFGSGYDLVDIKDQGLQTVHDCENWSMHDEYSWLYYKGLVPKVECQMLGFDIKEGDQCYYKWNDYSN